MYDYVPPALDRWRFIVQWRAPPLRKTMDGHDRQDKERAY
jgi:hypothetical protein